MAGKSQSKKPTPPRPPSDAVTFTLDRLWIDESGKRRKQRCQGQPDQEGGIVPEQFAAASFSGKTVLEVFGEGKYRVDFYDAKGKYVPESGRTFEVAKSPVRAPSAKRRPMAEQDPEDEPTAPRRRGRVDAGGGEFTMLDFLMMQKEDAKERERERREEAIAAEQRAQAQRQSDREFMTTMLTVMKGGAGDAPSSDILRRELALEIREGMSKMRRDLAGELDARETEPDPDTAPPKDIGEAGERIGMRIMAELEEKTPELINEAIPQIAAWLQSKGARLSPELTAELNRRKTNGAS